MDYNVKIDLSKIQELKTKGGSVIRELFFTQSLSYSSESGYPFKGSVAGTGAGQYWRTNIYWRFDGLTQEPLSRKMAWDLFDTPHLDISKSSLALLHQYLEKSHPALFPTKDGDTREEPVLASW
ncbi:hypothetical protein [Alteromonas sp. 14N.309.X.WAT.G.H12]|uniref:hypothetical protein n=1 Tax=Alteromonas sp. 14N.309.X.WAT.G.H12 TaxID=3120824 RepID=UPI002FCEB828